LTSAEHGDLDIALRLDGTAGYEVGTTATRQVAGTSIAVPIAARVDIVRSKRAADREKDRRPFAMRSDIYEAPRASRVAPDQSGWPRPATRGR